MELAAVPPNPKTDPPACGKILLVGHPNVGKSVLFNRLSGSNVTVSNYPGTTVDLQHSLTRVNGIWREIVDTPGARSLAVGSDDERVTQRCLLDHLALAPLPAAAGNGNGNGNGSGTGNGNGHGNGNGNGNGGGSGGGSMGTCVAVLQVGDAKNLRRTLFLTTQLIELDFPIVLSLNMLDECREERLLPDAERLSETLGIRVCPTTAITGEGMDRLEEAMRTPEAGSLRLKYPPAVEGAIEEISGLLDVALPGKRGLALLYISGDPAAEAWIAERVPAERVERMARARAAASRAFSEPLALVVHQARYDQVSYLARDLLVSAGDRRGLGGTVRRNAYYFGALPLLGAFAGLVSLYLLHFGGLKFLLEPIGISRALFLASGAIACGLWFLKRGLEHRGRDLSVKESLGELALFPSTAIPLLAVTLYAAYLIVGVFAAGTCVDFIENKVFAGIEGGPGFDVGFFMPLSDHFSADGEMAGWSLFHVPWKGINYYLAALAGTCLSSDGMLYQLFFGPTSTAAAGGAMDVGLVTVGLTYSIAIVLPIVLFFFLVFGILEDSGYLPRIAVLTDRSLKLIGLNGKAVLPLILGLGCDTMATMTTRILETRKERMVATLLLALAVPCSAQIGIISGVMARVSPISLLLFVGIILAQLVLVGLTASRIFRGRVSDFMIEIPPIRLPLWRNVIAKTYSRMKWFLVEAVPLFIAGTFILFVVDRLGVIPFLVDAGKPVVTGLLGLPEGTTVGFLLGFLRRDFAAVSILQSFADGDVAGGIDVRQVLVAVVVITLFVPCLANYFIMIREQGLKVATLMGAFIFPYAILVGFLLNRFLLLLPAEWLRGHG